MTDFPSSPETETVDAHRVAVMANYHHDGACFTPSSSEEAALYRLLDKRFKSWTGKSLQAWSSGHAQTTLPLEPTRAMREAAAYYLGSSLDIGPAWRAMIAALSDTSTERLPVVTKGLVPDPNSASGYSLSSERKD